MGPLIRIVIRYGVGTVVGYEVGSQLASDPDVIAVTTAGAAMVAGVVTEGFYWLAKKYGWRT